MKKHLLILAGAIACGAALLPLTTYAVDGDEGDATTPSPMPAQNDDPAFNRINCRNTNSLVEGANAADFIDTCETTVAINVNSTITIEVTANNCDLTIDSGGIGTCTIDSKVTSNAAYDIMIKSEKPDMAQYNEDGTYFNNERIFAATEANPVAAGSGSWGIKKKTDAEGKPLTDAIYSGVTTENQLFFHSAVGNPVDGITTSFPVGIAPSPNLSAGVYKTEINLTAITQ